MSFRISRGGSKRSAPPPLLQEDELIWGVPRRAGLDEQDDPKAHAGLTQHAFRPGNDERAICGFEPPKRASGPTAKPRAQLAIPNTRLNPRCPKCLKLIAPPPSPVAEEEPPVAETADQVAPEEVMALDVVPEQRIGELELEPATAVTADTDGEAPADKAAPADETAVEAGEPQPDDDLTQAEAFDELSAFAAAAATPTAAPEPKPARPTLPPPPPPPEPAPAKPAVMPPMSMRSASWEGTAVFEVGQQTALVRPPSQPGMGVVASVISGPSGTRVGSVQLNDDGLAVISLSEPARGPVAVAWFAVPAVDENLRPGRP